jgi:hypothetical protein
MSLKSVLTQKDFVRGLAPDGEIQLLLKEICSEKHHEELQRELTEEEKTLPQPLAGGATLPRPPLETPADWKGKAIFVLEFTRPDDSKAIGGSSSSTSLLEYEARSMKGTSARV